MLVMWARSRQPFGIAVVLVGGVMAAGCTGLPPVRQQPPAHPRARASTQSAARPGPGGGIRAENALPGYPGWRITHPGQGGAIEGYSDRASALPGSPVRLFVSTTAASFRVRALRFGWYGGTLARLVWTSPAIPGSRQPPAAVLAHGMAVAPWRPSLTLPTVGWPPGSYLLRLDASTGAQRYVPLVIRSPSVIGRVLLVQPTTTFQAYNPWGGYNLYAGPGGSYATRARAVSFDRPYASENGAGNFFQEEQPLVSYAERLGLPLAYVTSVDLDLNPRVLDGARAVVSEAHDEYWSPAMRAAVTRARDHGVNLAFFGANAIYRKIRFGSSRLGRDRIEVNYKNPREDPLYGRDNARVTGNWPDPPDADPESSLTGQAYACIGARAPMVVTDPHGWIWAGSRAHQGTRLPGIVGAEFDVVDPSGPTPRPIEIFARSPEHCHGHGAEGDVTYYVVGSGAGVVDAGTEGWICGLPTVAVTSSFCPHQSERPPAPQVIETATRNILQAFSRGPAGREHPARDSLIRQVQRAMSRTDIPFAYKLTITASRHRTRRACPGTSTGSKLPARSRGTCTRTGPTSVLSTFPLDPLPVPRPTTAALQITGQLRGQPRPQHLSLLTPPLKALQSCKSASSLILMAQRLVPPQVHRGSGRTGAAPLTYYPQQDAP